MSSPTTYIKRAVLDITMPEAYRDKGYEDRLSKAMLSELYGFIAEEIDKAFPGNERVVIDSLTLELGPLRSVNSEKEFVEKFREIFPEVLRNTLPEQPVRGSHVEMLREFFEKGNFPWWAPQDAANDPDELIRSLGNEDMERLAKWLREALARPAIRDRVAGQLRTATLEKLLNVLLGKNGAAIQQTISAALGSLKRSGIAWRTGTRQEETKWLLLQVARHKEETVFETRNVLAALVAEISQDTQVLVPELAASIARHAGSAVPQDVRTTFATLPQELLPSSRDHEDSAAINEERPARSPALQVFSHFVMHASIPPALFRGDEQELVRLLGTFAKKNRSALLLHLQPALQDPKLLLRMFRQLDAEHAAALFDVFFPGHRGNAIPPARKLLRDLSGTGTFSVAPASQPAMEFTIATLQLSGTFRLLHRDTLPVLLRPFINVDRIDTGEIAASRAFTSLPEPVQRIITEKAQEKKRREQKQPSSETKNAGKDNGENNIGSESLLQEPDDAAAFLNERFLADLLAYYIRGQHLPWWSKALRKRAGLLPGSFNPENEREFFSAALDYFATHHAPALKRFSKTITAFPETLHHATWLLPLPDLLKIAAAALDREDFRLVTIAQALLEKLRAEKNSTVAPGSAVRDLVAILLRRATHGKGTGAEPVFRAFIFQLVAQKEIAPAELARLLDSTLLAEGGTKPEQEHYASLIAQLNINGETIVAQQNTPVPPEIVIPEIRFRSSALAALAENILSGKIAQLPPVNPQELEEAILFSAAHNEPFLLLVKNAVSADAPAARWLADLFSPAFARKLFLLLTADAAALRLAEKTIGLLQDAIGSTTGRKELFFLAARVALRRKNQPANEFIAAFIRLAGESSEIKEQALQAELIASVAGELFRAEERTPALAAEATATFQQTEFEAPAHPLAADAFLEELSGKLSAAGEKASPFLPEDEKLPVGEIAQADQQETSSSISPQTEAKPGIAGDDEVPPGKEIPGVSPREKETPASVAAAWQIAAENKTALFFRTLLGNTDAAGEMQLRVTGFVREEQKALLERLSAQEPLTAAITRAAQERAWEKLATFVEEKIVRAIREQTAGATEQEISGEKKQVDGNGIAISEEHKPGSGTVKDEPEQEVSGQEKTTGETVIPIAETNEKTSQLNDEPEQELSGQKKRIDETASASSEINEQETGTGKVSGQEKTPDETVVPTAEAKKKTAPVNDEPEQEVSAKEKPVNETGTGESASGTSETPHKPITQQPERSSRDKLLLDPVFLVNTLIYFLQHRQLPWWSPYKSTEELGRFAALVIPGNRPLVTHHLGQLLADDELKRLVSSQLGESLHEDSVLWEKQLGTGFVIHLLQHLLEKEVQDETLRSLLQTGGQLIFLSEEHFDEATAERLLISLLAEIEKHKPAVTSDVFFVKQLDHLAWEELVTEAGKSFATLLGAGTGDIVKTTVISKDERAADEVQQKTEEEISPGIKQDTEQTEPEKREQPATNEFQQPTGFEAEAHALPGESILKPGKEDVHDPQTTEEISLQAEYNRNQPGEASELFSETAASHESKRQVGEDPGMNVPGTPEEETGKTERRQQEIHVAKAIAQFRERETFSALLQQLKEKSTPGQKRSAGKTGDEAAHVASVLSLLQPIEENDFVPAGRHLPGLAKLFPGTVEPEELLQAVVTLIAFMNGTGNRQVLNRILRQPGAASSAWSGTLTSLRRNAAAPPVPSLPLLSAELLGISESIAPDLLRAEKIMQWNNLLARTLTSVAAAGPVLVALVVQELSVATGKTTDEIVALVSEKLEALKLEETVHTLTGKYFEEAKGKMEFFGEAARNPYTSMFTGLRQRQAELHDSGRPIRTVLAEKLSKTLAGDPAFLSSLEKSTRDMAAKPGPQPKPLQTHEPWLYPLPEEKKGEPIYVFNSGLVLFWPFIGGLFRRLGYIEGKEFVDVEKQVRAVHLLQYMVDESEQPPEHLLPLNKLFCGLHPSAPLDRWIALTEDEKKEAGLFTASVKAKWEVLKHTSLENFRKGFVQREGLLYFKDPNWELQVQRISMDMLLQKLPWGFSTVKFPWNEGILFVKWKI